MQAPFAAVAFPIPTTHTGVLDLWISRASDIPVAAMLEQMDSSLSPSSTVKTCANAGVHTEGAAAGPRELAEASRGTEVCITGVLAMTSCGMIAGTAPNRPRSQVYILFACACIANNQPISQTRPCIWVQRQEDAAAAGIVRNACDEAFRQTDWCEPPRNTCLAHRTPPWCAPSLSELACSAPTASPFFNAVRTIEARSLLTDHRTAAVHPRLLV